MFEAMAQMPCIVSKEQNLLLKEPITNEELNMALNAMHSDKISSPDGWPVEFYTAMIVLIGEDLFIVVEEPRLKGRILHHLTQHCSL